MTSPRNKQNAIVETLRHEILLGKYNVRERFLSEGQICRRFGVSHMTARHTLERLKALGFLEAKLGSGTFLCANARNLTGKIAVLSPSIATGELTQAVCTHIARLVAEHGYTLLFGNASSESPAVRERLTLELAQAYTSERIAGVFIEPLELTAHAHDVMRQTLARFERHGIPVVLLDRDVVPPPERSGYDLVAIDNVQAGYRLARHLLDRGARHLCYCYRPGCAYTAHLRLQGARDAVLDAGLRWTSSSVLAMEPEDLPSLAKRMSRHPAPDAFLCCNDITAARLLQLLARLGIRVPDDVLVAGMDDVRIASLTTPPLTTLHQPCEDLARTAVDTLLSRIRNPNYPVRKLQLDAPLVIRASTGPKKVAKC